MSHAHLISLEKDITGKPEIEVKILLLLKLGKIVPVQAIAGTLFVLGIIVTIPENAAIAFATGDPILLLSAAAAVGVTAVVDPFFGLVAGILVKVLMTSFGLF